MIKIYLNVNNNNILKYNENNTEIKYNRESSKKEIMESESSEEINIEIYIDRWEFIENGNYIKENNYYNSEIFSNLIKAKKILK